MWFYHIKKNYSGNPRVMSENEEKKNPPPIPQKVKDILLRWWQYFRFGSVFWMRFMLKYAL